MSADKRALHQPIDPRVRPLLDPEYAVFHDKYFQYLIPDDQQPWDGSARTKKQSLPPTESKPVAVGSVRDVDLGNYQVRVFTPDSARPRAGWPVFIWFHGGGWAVGDISSGNDLCALVCQRARCVVVTVGYRLAPEHPYPAAFEDAVAAIKWVYGDEGSAELDIDRSYIAVGGTSAGGQLAASLAIEAGRLQPPIKIMFQLLVVPVLDNTATTATIWAANKHAPWLTPARMTWYRRMYLPEQKDTQDWKASPCLAPKPLLAKSPRTWIAVAEQDLLAPEAYQYAAQLEEAWQIGGVTDGEVVVKTYEGSCHPILALSGMFTSFFASEVRLDKTRY